MHSEQQDTITTYKQCDPGKRARDSSSSSPLFVESWPHQTKNRANRTPPEAPPVLCKCAKPPVCVRAETTSTPLPSVFNHPQPNAPLPHAPPSIPTSSAPPPPPPQGSSDRHPTLLGPHARRIIVGRPRRAVFVQPDSSKSLSKGFIGVGRVPGSRRRRSSSTTATTTSVPASASRSGPLGKSLTGGLQDDEERLPSWRGAQLEGVREVVPRGDLAEEGLFVLWGGGVSGDGMGEGVVTGWGRGEGDVPWTGRPSGG